jgi:hypothetical protein
MYILHRATHARCSAKQAQNKRADAHTWAIVSYSCMYLSQDVLNSAYCGSTCDVKAASAVPYNSVSSDYLHIVRNLNLLQLGKVSGFERFSLAAFFLIDSRNPCMRNSMTNEKRSSAPACARLTAALTHAQLPNSSPLPRISFDTLLECEETLSPSDQLLQTGCLQPK